MKQKYLFAVLLLLVAGLQSMKAQEAYACYTSGNTTLTFYYDTQRSSRAGETFSMNAWREDPGWHREDIFSVVTKVKFEPSFANARPTTTERWFQSMWNLQSIIGLEYLNTSEVTDMTEMFYGCELLTSLDLSHFNTSKVESMFLMFYLCEALTSLDLRSFDTSNVTNMRQMFSCCPALASLDLSSFNTSNVKNMDEMFGSCSALTSLDLSSFNTSKVTDMGFMFRYDSALKTIYVGSGWNTSSVTFSNMMFYACTSLVGGQGTTYNPNQTDADYAHIDGGTSNPGYFTEKPNKRGDVNLDGSVDIADAVCVLNAMAGQSVAGDANVNGDYDTYGNPVIDIADLVTVLNIMAGQ